ncbi:MAG: hypothetical protein ACI8UO_004145 [Verrucomicrobiales bacterium]|jgi:hypothetical protein
MIDARQTRLILDSYRHWLGSDLIERSGSEETDAENLFKVPFVVVSHDTSDDPILNYGNRAALQLWEAEPADFLKMPSRKTAEPIAREERARMLAETAAKGFIDDYSGVRITSKGERFFIPKAIVWNLVCDDGEHSGQAATFGEWEFLA